MEGETPCLPELQIATQCLYTTTEDCSCFNKETFAVDFPQSIMTKFYQAMAFTSASDPAFCDEASDGACTFYQELQSCCCQEETSQYRACYINTAVNEEIPFASPCLDSCGQAASSSGEKGGGKVVLIIFLLALAAGIVYYAIRRRRGKVDSNSQGDLEVTKENDIVAKVKNLWNSSIQLLSGKGVQESERSDVEAPLPQQKQEGVMKRLVRLFGNTKGEETQEKGTSSFLPSQSTQAHGLDDDSSNSHDSMSDDSDSSSSYSSSTDSSSSDDSKTSSPVRIIAGEHKALVPKSDEIEVDSWGIVHGGPRTKSANIPAVYENADEKRASRNISQEAERQAMILQQQTHKQNERILALETENRKLKNLGVARTREAKALKQHGSNGSLDIADLESANEASRLFREKHLQSSQSLDFLRAHQVLRQSRGTHANRSRESLDRGRVSSSGTHRNNTHHQDNDGSGSKLQELCSQWHTSEPKPAKRAW